MVLLLSRGRIRFAQLLLIWSGHGPNFHIHCQTLVKDGQSFSRLIEEFGSPKEEEQEGEKQEDPKEKAAEGVKKLASGKPGAGAALMSEEERETGAVSLSVYKRYLRHAGGVLWGPIILLLLVLTQGASGENLRLRLFLCIMK